MKKLTFSLILLILPLFIFSEESSLLASDFASLEKGMSREAVEKKYGLPNEYRSANATQYIYYIENNQCVLIRFNPSSHILVNASVWQKNIEQWPVTTKPIKPSGVTIQLSDSENDKPESNVDENSM